MKKASKISLSTRDSWTGLFFVMPFIIGFLIFFFRPMLQSLKFVFSDVTVELSGYHTKFAGLKNLNYIFKENVDYTTDLISGVTELFWKVPIIVISALFFAIILNQKFRGRIVVRAIFFLPVIISSGIILTLIQGDAAASSVMSGNVAAGGQTIQSDTLKQVLINSGLSSDTISGIMIVVNNLFNLMWKTGIQMTIFLAGIQGIPVSLYEASSIEGATAWESFWKITIPMLSPMILLNIIYTIIDNFTDSQNAVMLQVINNSQAVKYGWASAMSWVYSLVIGATILIVLLIFRKMNALASDQY